MFVWITLAGVIGAVSRFLLDLWFTERLVNGLPWSTFVINVIGSFFAGVAWAAHQSDAGLETLSVIAMTGFLGAFTTFSTFTLQWFLDLLKRKFAIAISYIILSVLTGVFGAMAGYLLAELILI